MGNVERCDKTLPTNEMMYHIRKDATLRARGLVLVVVSNWDHSLHERLAETALAPLLDAAVASAELGHAPALAA
mgnify:CR=1 FL=1